jgi:polysaccharide biosynthesis transport protein
LSSLKMQEVLDEAAVRFDRIVVDSPAVIAVADARVLTRLMDRTVYIVQWGRTPRNLALRGFDMLHQSGGFVVGPVFAQVDGVSEAYGGSSYIRNYMYDSQRYL